MIGRYAPSPTGDLHLGNLRTAVLAWLFARSARSAFVLRFEDLDQGVVRPEFYDRQRRDLERLGLDWDSELCQIDHLERYRETLNRLTAGGLTYECFCTRREIREAASAPNDGERPEGAYPGTCRTLSAETRQAHLDAGRSPAIRLRSTETMVTFQDRLLGSVTGRPDDTVLARRDGTPAYNLVVVLDDHHQGVEEVVRGDDLASSTPRQIVIAETLGQQPPAYAHVPLVLGPDGSRLAKRDGAVTLDDRNALGETDAEVLGALAASLRLSAGGPVASAAELLDRFDPEALPREPWQLGASELDPPGC